MRRLTCYVVAMLAVTAEVAHAQIIRPQFNRSPAAYVSLGIGWLQQQGFCDKDSGDCWNFGNGPQWRASFEMPLGYGGSAWGIVGTMARIPLQYQGSGLLNSCANCDADANVTQILGLFKMSGGQGFHQVIDVTAGGVLFNNFRAVGGTRLGSGKTTTRFTGALAYGFGYGFSPRSEVFVEQEYGIVFLPRTPGNNNNMAQQQTLRVGARFGIGDKR